MERSIVVLALLASFSLHAQAPPYIPPDGHGEPSNPAVGFWENLGQIVDTNGDPVPDVNFYSEGGFPRAYLREDSKVSFVVSKVDTNIATLDTMVRIDMQPIGELVSYKKPISYEVNDVVENFYLAHTGSSGVEDVHGYNRIIYKDIYPYVDEHFYSAKSGQKIAFVIRPGGTPGEIRLKFTGQDSLHVDLWGLLHVYFHGRYFVLNQAIAYQVSPGGTIIPISWTPHYNATTDVVTFTVGSYLTGLPLIFQIGPPPALGGGFDVPGLCWSTLMGGGADEEVFESTQDDDDNYYVTGNTNSSFLSFPPAPGSNYSSTGKVAFLMQLSTSDQIVWKDFYGGNVDTDETYGTGVADKGGNDLYMAGYTNSTSIIQWNDGTAYFDGTATSTTFKGFIGRFRKSSGVREWSTYFGNENLVITGMAGTSNIASPRIYITGYTQGDLPALDIAPPLGSTFWNYSSGEDGFVAGFNGDDKHYWRTYLPGSSNDRAVDIDRDKDKVMILGHTTSSDMHVSSVGGGAYEEGYSGGGDCFLYEFNIYGAWQWGTYVGSTLADWPGENALSIDPLSEDIAIAGRTLGALDIVPGPGWYQDAPPPTASQSGFIARFSDVDRSLVWQTYLHGTVPGSINFIQAVCFDEVGNLNIGATPRYGGGLPIAALAGMYSQVSMNPNLSGGAYEFCDMYLMSFTPDHYLAWATYFGGQASDEYHEMLYTLLTRELNGNLYGAGFTSNNYFSNFFYLDDGGGVPYFEPNFHPTGILEGFLVSFCASPLTGIHEQTTPSTPTIWYDGHGQVQLFGLIPGIRAIRIHDALGRLVYADRLRADGAGTCEVPIGDLSSGVYLLATDLTPAVPFLVEQ